MLFPDSVTDLITAFVETTPLEALACVEPDLATWGTGEQPTCRALPKSDHVHTTRCLCGNCWIFGCIRVDPHSDSDHSHFPCQPGSDEEENDEENDREYDEEDDAWELSWFDPEDDLHAREARHLRGSTRRAGDDDRHVARQPPRARSQRSLKQLVDPDSWP